MSAPRLRAIERFNSELDALLSDIAFAGLRNVYAVTAGKLESLADTARLLGMETGAALLAEFSAALREYRAGSAAPDGAAARSGKAERCISLLCKLEFYAHAG
ncbi:MAG: hypothetical protein LBB82_09175 [Treponema sp.]|jgi:hypothetical protein|nr:hypothetical protein [Treponema sp.]